MLVLGKSNDDKGTQLETLTRNLLSDMGYTNIVRNFISTGGEEIDVSADIAVPNLGGAQLRRLICECKAHRTAIAMPDWLKFLGKVLVEETELGGEVSACFIALGGVNGPVAGNYDKLKARRQNIKLIEGDTLTNEITRMYDLCGIEKVNDTLRRHTDRQYRTLEVAYYDLAVYRIVIFEHDAYTILNAQGEPLEDERAEALKPLVEAALSTHTFISLREEAEARRRAEQAQKSVLAQLIIKGDSLNTSELEGGEVFSFTMPEFEQAVENLVARNWIVNPEGQGIISFLAENDVTFYARLAEVYLFLFGGEPGFNLPAVLRSPFYSKYINEQMVAEIQHIQGGVPLSPEDVVNAVKLLRWSPSALLWAVQPDEMLVNSRNADNSDIIEQINRFQRDYLFQQLYRSLRFDMTHPIARAYMLGHCHIREIETTQKVTVKSGTGVQLESDLHERIGIGELADGYVGPDGGKYMLVRVLEDAPQPWEQDVWKQTDEQPYENGANDDDKESAVQAPTSA